MDSILGNPYKEINYIPKGSVRKYKFMSKQHSQLSNDMYNAPNIVFYQVSVFLHPKKGMHHIRRFTVNNNKIVSVKESFLTDEKYKKFLQTKPTTQYQKCADLDLNTVNYPTFNDIVSARSDLLSDKTNYTGYAQF